MTHSTYRLTCDCCNRREHNEGDETQLELYASSDAKGWTLRKVPNGATWDLCPECSKIETENLP